MPAWPAESLLHELLAVVFIIGGERAAGHGSDYNGVFLGWNRVKGAPAAAYALTPALDEDADPPGKKKDSKDKEPDKAKKKERESPDFTIELVTSDGVVARAPVSRYTAVPPPLKERFTKLPPMESQD